MRIPDVYARLAPNVTPKDPKADGSFGDKLSALLDRVEAPQQEADFEAERLAVGEGNLHEAALALEKADITLRLAVRSRNKVVEAYQEIMRMQV